MPIVFNVLSVFSLLLIPALSSTQPALEKEGVDIEQPQVFSYITPPKGWEITNPKFLAKSVQIAFIKKTNNIFCPSINLAIEKSNLSLPEYLNVIRQIHESNKRNRWRQLGKVHTLSGIGQLTEIDTTTEFGAVRMLQLILVKQGYTYVVTAAALKEEIAEHYREFQSTFRSLQVTSDLISTVPQMERRDSLKERSKQLISSWQQTLHLGATSLLDPAFQKEQWVPFQTALVQDFEDMGPHWQVLMLKNIQEKMIALIPQTPLQIGTPTTDINSMITDNAESDLLGNEELLDEASIVLADPGEHSPLENDPELSANEENIVEGTLQVQENSLLPTALMPHAEIADNVEHALFRDEKPLMEPTSQISDADEHSFSADPIYHVGEISSSTPLSSFSPRLECVFEDGQNTP